jgi:hypothetical protein
MKHIELNLILKHQCVLLANKGRGYHGCVDDGIVGRYAGNIEILR